MDAPTLPVSAERNLGDPIKIRVDIVHPIPVDLFPAATVVRTLRFIMGMVKEENASLRGKIKTMKATDTITRRQEKRSRMELERQLTSVQESWRQDQENFRKLQELVTKEGNIILQVLAKVGTTACKLELPQRLSRVHNTFHELNLKKCMSDESLVISLEELRVDNKLHFVEEPMEVMDHEIKQLKRSRISIIKVRQNSKRGPEFTWEHEDQFKQKYPHLLTKTAPSSSATS
ncbi:hypothetical protein Tco_0699559 [Tanacetum coccineum]